MKKLILKTVLFTFPFFLLLITTICFYNKNKGDLLRLGYIADIEGYDMQNIFKKDFAKKINFTKVSDLNLSQNFKCDVFTIGDSFSEQGPISYHNFLCDNTKIKGLYLDRYLHDNPIETVHGFLNSDVLNKINTKYIIIQSVEREFVKRGLNVNSEIKINATELNSKTKENKNKSKVKEKSKDLLFQRENLKLVLNAIKYQFDDNAGSSDTYQLKTKRKLFCVAKSNIMILDEDLQCLETNNNTKNIDILNSHLNTLARKLNVRGIKLIVVPAPDKLDFYYNEIENNKCYPKPIFFDYMINLKKEYLYIDSKKILQQNTKTTKDIYFYDDTHWSPIASKIIAKEIDKIIINNQ